MALSMNSVGIFAGFRGNTGFSGKFGLWDRFDFGMVSVDLGGQKAFVQTATSHHVPSRVHGQKDLCSLGSEDSTYIFDPWTPNRVTPPQPDGHRPKRFMLVCLFLS